MTAIYKEAIASRFGNAADHYDEHADLQRHVADQLARYLPALDKDARILEIGCGTGFLTRHLCGLYDGADVTISDLSSDMVALCESRYGQNGFSFRQMDGEVPDIDGKFDLIVSSLAFQWFVNIGEALERLKAMLKPEGQVLFSIIGPQSMREWKEALKKCDLPAGTLQGYEPVCFIDEERLSFHYETALECLNAIKRIGAHTPREGYSPLTLSQLRQATKVLQDDYNASCRWQVFYSAYSADG